MDYVAKQQFIDWMRDAREALLVITHDRDVLKEVDRIVELKDGGCVSYKGNYDDYLKQNAVSTGSAMTEFELIERRIANLKTKVIQFRRLKEKARDPDTIKQFKRRETQAAKELDELQKIKKPTFWIDKTSAENLDFKTAGRYEKFKAKNIRMNLKSEESRSKHVLVSAKSLSLGYGDTPLFSHVAIDLREGEALELRGRNGAGKTTLVKAILNQREAHEPTLKNNASPVVFSGEITLDRHMRVGVYEQEVSQKYFELSLADAIERMYLDKNLPISTTKIRGLMNDYLFTDGDGAIPLSKLSGGQKARFQLITMLANDPQLLVLDEPTNHLDLPSIEELETALAKYSGAILYVSHDGYFRAALGGDVVTVGAS
jgi:ATPase subunit of ABC transporter with duplicated ATPase domains